MIRFCAFLFRGQEEFVPGNLRQVGRIMVSISTHQTRRTYVVCTCGQAAVRTNYLLVVHSSPHIHRLRRSRLKESKLKISYRVKIKNKQQQQTKRTHTIIATLQQYYYFPSTLRTSSAAAHLHINQIITPTS